MPSTQPDDLVNHVTNGLTKREHFASLMMAQMACIDWEYEWASENRVEQEKKAFQRKARSALMQADALIAELNKEQS